METEEESNPSDITLDAESEAIIGLIAAIYGLPLCKTKTILFELGWLSLSRNDSRRVH